MIMKTRANMRRRTQLSMRIMAAMLIFAVSGCGDSDATNNPRYGFAPLVGTRWKTRTKTAIAEGERGRLYLLVPYHFDPDDPAYKSHLANLLPGIRKMAVDHPDQKRDLLAALPPGTGVLIDRLMQDNGESGGVMPTAIVDVGPYAGKRLYLDAFFFVPNRFLQGPFSYPSATWAVDPKMLEPAH